MSAYIRTVKIIRVAIFVEWVTEVEVNHHPLAFTSTHSQVSEAALTGISIQWGWCHSTHHPGHERRPSRLAKGEPTSKWTGNGIGVVGWKIIIWLLIYLSQFLPRIIIVTCTWCWRLKRAEQMHHHSLRLFFATLNFQLKNIRGLKGLLKPILNF